MDIWEYIVEVPVVAKKEDLVLLKQFLEKEESWNIKIFIDLKGQKVDTKLSLKELVSLKKWIKDIWG